MVLEGCESLLSQCQYAIFAAFGAVVAALIALVKAHYSEKYVRANLIEKAEEKEKK